MKTLSSIAIACLFALFASASQAAVFGFSCITNNLASNCAIGESQISVDITAGGANQAVFTFSNTGPGQSTISEIYFDDGTLLGISTIVGSSQWVKFNAGSASPPELPGANSMAVPFQTTAGFLADAKNPAPKYGVSPGESVQITFQLLSGVTVADTIAAMGTDLRIGVHVINFASGGSESLVAPPTEVPAPAAFWLMGSALAAAAGLRRLR